jgi:AbrB family looped-hinge helix DNA binding protein
MPIVRVGPKGQITIPNDLRRETKIGTGSYLEAEVRHNGIVLKPVQAVGAVSGADVEAAIAEGLEDHRAGRVSGPYKNMAEFKARRRKQKTR